jgi:5-formyltetrahydrofolate cyclo-ligase
MNGYLESQKRKIRRDFLALRNEMKPFLTQTCSRAVLARIKELPAYKKAKIIMFYLSCGSEVPTDLMINSALSEGKTVVVPAIESRRDRLMCAMKILKVEDACQLVYGVRQPEIKPNYAIEKCSIDLIFVPGIAFSVKGSRTGYGKGFYDRWLKDIPVEKVAGLAYDFQIMDKLPVGKYDLPVGSIVTEKRIIEAVKVL